MTQNKVLLVLVNSAFTGPNGPREEAFTMETPPSVFRMLLMDPITNRRPDIPDIPRIPTKRESWKTPMRVMLPKERANALKLFVWTSCLH